MKLHDNQIETAPLTALIASATVGQMARAEAAATKAMHRISNPVVGAREIVLAQALRRELRSERVGIAALLSSLAA